tara:strand:+ start:6001 stop:6516 length:516 start_codon:yes stop_codon:yes gene_type:complete
MAIYYPPVFINAYLAEKIPEQFGNDFILPFFPTSPTDIDTLTEQFPDGIGAIYDRMFKMRRSPFPHIKSEQLLYYFYKTAGDPVRLIESTQIVQDLLDREDESAQEINSWIRLKQLSATPLTDENGEVFPPVYFHKIKIYQLEETRDIIDFGTARTYAGNKIIIDYDWHKS